ncbi:uncharacterized protein V6R79_014900 [Siganus canaliculatus]
MADVVQKKRHTAEFRTRHVPFNSQQQQHNNNNNNNNTATTQRHRQPPAVVVLHRFNIVRSQSEEEEEKKKKKKEKKKRRRRRRRRRRRSRRRRRRRVGSKRSFSLTEEGGVSTESESAMKPALTSTGQSSNLGLNYRSPERPNRAVVRENIQWLHTVPQEEAERELHINDLKLS